MGFGGIAGEDMDLEELISISAASSIKWMSEHGDEGHKVSGLLTLSTSTLLQIELPPPPPPVGDPVGVERSISLAGSYI